MVAPIAKHNEQKKNESSNAQQGNIFSLSNHTLEVTNTNLSYSFVSKKFLYNLYHKTKKKLNSRAFVDFDLEKLIQTLISENEGRKNKTQNYNENIRNIISDMVIKDLSTAKSTDVHYQTSPTMTIVQSTLEKTTAKMDNGSKKDETNSKKSKSYSIQQKIKRSPFDAVGFIEYILLAVFIVFDVTLLACCINDKYRAKIFQLFTLCPLNGKTNVCDMFRRCSGSWRYSSQSYQVISVQEMCSMARTMNTNRNDFIFDDQYLELNDNPVADASLKLSILPSSPGDCKMENLKKHSDNVETSMYQQFSNSIKRMTKPKYVRLDEVSQDDKEHDVKLEVDTTHHGYWNPAYFSLMDETDV